MAVEEVQKGAVGHIIELTVKEDDGNGGLQARDISSFSTTKTIYGQPPSGIGNVKTWSASFTTDGTDGKIQYSTTAGDLDEHKDWKVQGFVSDGTNQFHTEVVILRVKDNLA